jgi:hypothetical protein
VRRNCQYSKCPTGLIVNYHRPQHVEAAIDRRPRRRRLLISVKSSIANNDTRKEGHGNSPEQQHDTWALADTRRASESLPTDAPEHRWVQGMILDLMEDP